MARRRFYRWNFVFSEKTFEESFRDSASRRGVGGGMVRTMELREGGIKCRARGGTAHFKRESRRENGEESMARERRDRWAVGKMCTEIYITRNSIIPRSISTIRGVYVYV